jgi:hypothetical protein
MTFRRAITASLIVAVAACSKPAPQPSPPPPVATPTPAPAPPPVTAPRYDNWMDAPATPGDWSYVQGSGGSLAHFGVGNGIPRFSLRCEPSLRRVTVIRYETQGAAPPVLTIRAEEATRALTAQPAADRMAVGTVLPATDPLLAAMAFSKGRFAVEAEGLPTLYLPAWPEVTRVIEDCL